MKIDHNISLCYDLQMRYVAHGNMEQCDHDIMPSHTPITGSFPIYGMSNTPGDVVVDSMGATS